MKNSKELTHENVAEVAGACLPNGETFAEGEVIQVVTGAATWHFVKSRIENHREQIVQWITLAGPYVPKEIRPTPFHAPGSAYACLKETADRKWATKKVDSFMLVALGLAAGVLKPHQFEDEISQMIYQLMFGSEPCFEEVLEQETTK